MASCGPRHPAGQLEYFELRCQDDHRICRVDIPESQPQISTATGRGQRAPHRSPDSASS
ncbi:MAG TPA: hypothetical protein VMW53_09760 [archaeon]|nr:hypothetical protein [archaeon]